jgi:uncharacterized protein YajQ (UPF0234 family)
MKKKNKNMSSGDWFDNHVVVEGLSSDENKKIKKFFRDKLSKKPRSVNEGWNDGNPMNG